MRFNMAYYLARKEKPFSDYPDQLALQEKNEIEKRNGYHTSQAAVDLLQKNFNLP